MDVLLQVARQLAVRVTVLVVDVLFKPAGRDPLQRIRVKLEGIDRNHERDCAQQGDHALDRTLPRSPLDELLYLRFLFHYISTFHSS